MEDRSEEDKRNLERMLCYLDVFDQTTGDLIGNANDIHLQGLNLISKEELPLLENLSIWVEDPRDNVRIPLVIEGVWNQMEIDPVYYSTGCRVHMSASVDSRTLSEFIEKIKNNIKKRSKLTPPYTPIM